MEHNYTNDNKKKENHDNAIEPHNTKTTMKDINI